MFIHLNDLQSVARHMPQEQCRCSDWDVYDGHAECAVHPVNPPPSKTREEIEAWLDDVPTGVAEIVIEIDYKDDTLAIQGTPEQLRTLSRQIALLIDKEPA